MQKLLLAVLFTSVTLVPTKNAQQPEQRFTIVVSGEELNQILKGLGSQPFNDVANTILDIRNQAQHQLDSLNKVKPAGNHVK